MHNIIMINIFLVTARERCYSYLDGVVLTILSYQYIELGS